MAWGGLEQAGSLLWTDRSGRSGAGWCDILSEWDAISRNFSLIIGALINQALEIESRIVLDRSAT